MESRSTHLQQETRDEDDDEKYGVLQVTVERSVKGIVENCGGKKEHDVKLTHVRERVPSCVYCW